jgi:hypothetical protein
MKWRGSWKKSHPFSMANIRIVPPHDTQPDDLRIDTHVIANRPDKTMARCPGLDPQRALPGVGEKRSLKPA